MKFHVHLFRNIPFLLVVMFMFTTSTLAQPAPEPLVRLSKLEIDPAQLDSYKKALKEEIEDSMRLEPGVLTLYAVFEKKRPTHLTILEIYASQEAYQAHIKSPHFLKYKVGTQSMVKHLELIDGEALIVGLGIKSVLEN